MPRTRRLATGKVPLEVLERCVFPRLGKSSERVLRGASIGEDAPIIDMGEKVLVVKANPITGAEENIGHLVVHINANDVATRGAKPQWFLSIILLPEGATEKLLNRIASEIHEACLQLGVNVIGGHTECTPGLKGPVLAGFMIGEAQKDTYLPSNKPENGDLIVMTKYAGLEGTSILANDLEDALKGKMNPSAIKKAKMHWKHISVVNEALRALELGGVHAMHTPTEGGIQNGLYEMTKSSGLASEVYIDRIQFLPETVELSEALGLDPLKLMSSGSLLIAVAASKANIIVKELTNLGIKTTIIGKFTTKGKPMFIDKDTRREIESVKQDEVYRIISS